MSDQPRGRQPDLQSIQRWMQSVITHPFGIEAGIESEEAGQEIDVSAQAIESVVARSRARTSIQRLEVYGNAYYARLLECLRGMFSALVYALGKDSFDEFAFGYLQNYPSRSYSLGFLADNFVRYLEETRPPSDGEAEVHDWVDFVIELARMEWTIDQVFDGPGMEKVEPLTAQDLAEISPQQWHQARLIPVPCLRVLRFRFPVSEYFAAFRADEDPDFPEPQETFVAISRKDYVVRRFQLSSPEFTLLDALLRGATVGEAIERVAEAVDDLNDLADLLGRGSKPGGSTPSSNALR